MPLPTATELLLAMDAARPRTQQREMGISGLGKCRRRAGYQVQGYDPDPGYQTGGIQAVLGTAIHQALAEAAARELPGAEPESLEVEFGGLVGHPDLYYLRTVRDNKTLGYAMQVENRRQSGPAMSERWQVHVYGAALILAGWPVERVEIDYLARDSGDEYLFAEDFSVDVVAQAMAWLHDVRTSPVELLPRDFRPDSATCRGCQFFGRFWDTERGKDDRHVLFADDPDAAGWARRLEEARRVRKWAEQQEADCKGALDHLRGVGRPGESQEVAVPGLDGQVLRFSVQRGKESPDMGLIALDYQRAGARPPMRRGEPVVRVAVVKPKE